eukprot:CAMPEP_0119324572 /NCGR_PEP_ID=MMETSP1333-20130426/63622_1 /TAXON_ID=418940 /ORGANISM="Scyphosphaera apsteinii, Strain RCC1455" /LENGTH=348 /DNA_ID=CAMNT_0007332309 /DNA_START=70 /DNA_END=1116 /DNA_ORIENTATION=-
MVTTRARSRARLPVLVALPDEVMLLIFSHLKASNSASVLGVCHIWNDLVAQVCHDKLRSERAQLWDGMVHRPRLWLKARMSIDELSQRVGHKPQHSWRHEWTALQVSMMRSHFGDTLSTEQLHYYEGLCKPGGKLSIEMAEKDFRTSSAWKVQAGWDQEQAVGYTLITAAFKPYLCRAFQQRSRELAASSHLLADALARQAWRLSEPAPSCYAGLTGLHGLVGNDNSWAVLQEQQLAIGSSFVTSAFVETSANSTCLRKDGFNLPLNSYGRIVHHLQDTDVVHFVSEPTDNDGFHSLIPTCLNEHELEYDLPAPATITLRSISDSWLTDDGTMMRRRVFTVGVTYMVA